MKRICLYPFCSQQDKLQRKFLLTQDSGLAWMLHLANALHKDGECVAVVLPMRDQCVDFDAYAERLPSGVLLTQWTPLDNFRRRFHWNMEVIDYVADISRAVVTHHEYISVPLKAAHPSLRVVSECVFHPDTAWKGSTDLFRTAWQSADVVLCANEELCTLVRIGYGNAQVLKYAYDADIATARPPCARDIDVLFNVRASATNFTNHRLFVDALMDSGLKVACTDPTRYLALTNEAPKEWLPEQPYTREQYIDLLHRSKVVVCLTENGSAGTSLHEAIACGCRPVALDLPQFRELGIHHLCYKSAVGVFGAVRSALASTLPMPDVYWSSYQAAYPMVKELLCL